MASEISNELDLHSYFCLYTFYHKTKCWLDGEDNAMSLWRPRLKPCYQQLHMEHMTIIYKFYLDKIINNI
jgi:hypothetical protein